MPTDEKPKTGKLNGRLWGARARDWSELQEPMTRRVYDAVFQRIGVERKQTILMWVADPVWRHSWPPSGEQKSPALMPPRTS